mmetsp:Transcript_25/g.41  ORF Transcript_25/g.41 Transcript_25/m.41 type:complete len:455 (+) Transcript_25:170-1534(+)
MLRFALGRITRPQFGRMTSQFPDMSKSHHTARALKGIGQLKTFATSSQQSARAARKSRLAQATNPIGKKKESPIMATVILGSLGLLSVSGYLINDIMNNPHGDLGKQYYGSNLEKAVNVVYDYTVRPFNDMFYPASDKLLPDWPTAPCYANVPPGTPCPPLLVLDLEKTLVGSTYDAQFGWRHVKRPGLDKFLKAMAGYYEIVIFSENDIGIALDIIQAIDPENVSHRLGSAAAETRGTSVLKRLDLMNRDIRQIILIDDSEDSSQLCPENTLLVTPFNDVNSKHDRVLEDLIPLLQAFVHHGATDFRRTLEDLGTHEATEAVTEYRMRLSEKKLNEAKKRNRGLGGLIRGPLREEDFDAFESKSAVLSPSTIVGVDAKEANIADHLAASSTGSSLKNNYFHKDAPKPSNKKKPGKALQWLEKNEKNKEEEQLAKQQKMQEIYMERQRLKAEKK